ncbi:hypothetical protein KO481_11190 [Nocardia sp. NEAU-G5]|uniref:PPE family domain-containing protein n=1 Tax=Nocardia albiluteola TaxID=2842303 RepID=A0ABS6AVN5_9NOCA|nr:hypothetical protein [Nocardia albiluteola]MBU3062087.1 hypothetical protein [Nocardia albiluteola]
MTTYDAPGITDPENVDALTHQQIYDAFQTVGDHCADIVTAWQQAGDQWRTSTTGLVQAVRTAVDGHWTGSAAEAAVQAVTGYGTRATDLADLFDQTGQVVANTAQAAQTTKAYISKPVPVTADQTKDPTEFDTQTRNASKAQDDARQTMQQRYVVPFTTEDARIPTFPPANSTGAGDNPLTALASATTNGVRVSIPGVASIDIPGLGTRPDSTVPAGVHTSLFGTPVTNPDASVTALTDNSVTSRPTANDVLYRPQDRTVLTGDPQVPAATRPASTAPVTAPTTPASTSPHDAPTDTTSRDGTHDTPQHSDSDTPRSEHGTHTTPADNGSRSDGRTPAETHSAANDSAASQAAASQTASNQAAANETTSNQAAASQATSNQVTANQATSNQPAPTTHTDTGSTAAPSAGSSGGAQNATATPGSTDSGAGGSSDSGRGGANVTQNTPRLPTTVPGTALPGALAASSAAGSALGAAASIAAPALGAGSMIPNPPSTPNIPPAPTAPAPGPSAPPPSPGAPAPGSSAPGPNLHSGPIGQGPNSPAPVPSSPTPGTNPPSPAPNTQTPRPIAPTPTGGTPATPPLGSAAATNSIPPDALTEPAATAITGAAAAELSDDPHQHHDPRMPRMRVKYEGDRDRIGKTVDLGNESTTAEMARTEDYVQATIGDHTRRDNRERAATEDELNPAAAETAGAEPPVEPVIGEYGSAVDQDPASPIFDRGVGSTPHTDQNVQPQIGDHTARGDHERPDTGTTRGNEPTVAETPSTAHLVQPAIGNPGIGSAAAETIRANDVRPSMAGTEFAGPHVEPVIGEYGSADDVGDHTPESARSGLDSGAAPGNEPRTAPTPPTESYVQPTIGEYPSPDDPNREGADPRGESLTAGTTLSGQYVQPTIGE